MTHLESYDIFFQFKDDLSGADIKAICTEAGLLALRERRMKVSLFSYHLYPFIESRNFNKIDLTLSSEYGVVMDPSVIILWKWIS